MAPWISILFLAFSATGTASCVAVAGDRILAGDLATTQSAFEGLNAALVYSFAPPVGTQRVLEAADLSRWATAHGLTNVQVQPICIERAAWKIQASDVEAAVRAMFPSTSGLQVDVIEVCNCVVPHGNLRFPLGGVSAPPPGHPDYPTVWHGKVVSESQEEFPIWIRVRVLARRTIIRAIADMRSHEAVQADQIEQVSAMESPLGRGDTETAAEYTGMTLSRAVKKGEVLDRSLVSPPKMIEKGSIVKVDVIDGPTQLLFEAKAESSGDAGDLIILLNPTSLEKFHARVTGPGKSEIILGKDSITSPNALEKNTSVNPTMPKKSL